MARDNYCFICDCYDPDMGCTMPSVDRAYACSLETDFRKTEFFIPMILPSTTHQEKQVTVVKGKPQFYEPDDLKAARAKFEAYFAQHIPEKKYTNAVQLLTKWCYPITGDHYNGEWKTSKPDTDNIVKLPKDVMTKLGYWKDDAIVAREIIEKFWADIPGVYVCIEELT